MKKFTFRLLAASIGTVLFLSACSAEQGSKTNSSESGSASDSLSVSAGSSSNGTNPASSKSQDAGVTSSSRAPSSAGQIPPASSTSVSQSSSSKPAPQAQTPASQSQTQQVPASVPQSPPVSAPAPVPAPAPEPAPTPAPEPTPPPAPAFDVNTWVSFAISYGQGIGLTADSSATDCWDTPITAGPNSIYLERDICGRLDWYKSDGMTSFWVWASPRGDGAYDLFIGYA